MFSKRGRVVFESQEGVGADDVFDDAVEAGAEDVDVDKNGDIIVRRFWGGQITNSRRTTNYYIL
jgi:transcriptional/translational regulatory protein YebC/TACO1